MKILALDPGNEKTALVIFDTERNRIEEPTIRENEWVAGEVESIGLYVDALAIEMVACYGMAVGKEVFETCIWIGRFIDRYEHKTGKTAAKVYRQHVKLHLCNSARAKDANIRQALIDRFGGASAKGTKANPGPLRGISSHLWSALAVAVYYADTCGVVKAAG